MDHLSQDGIIQFVPLSKLKLSVSHRSLLGKTNKELKKNHLQHANSKMK